MSPFLVMNLKRGLKAVFLSLLRLLYGLSMGRCFQTCIGARTKEIAKIWTFLTIHAFSGNPIYISLIVFPACCWLEASISIVNKTSG
jgi:hypothetical protein